MVRNFYTITSYLFGPDCLLARAWKIVLNHAKTNEATYKRFERDYQYFYVSILDELHRRTQTFIHSAADGIIANLKVKQLDFSIILDAVENHTYFVRRPAGLPKRKQEQTNPSNAPAPKQKKPNPTRGELVYNSNVHKDMQVPKPGTYHEVFAPEFTKGIPVKIIMTAQRNAIITTTEDVAGPTAHEQRPTAKHSPHLKYPKGKNMF